MGIRLSACLSPHPPTAGEFAAERWQDCLKNRKKRKNEIERICSQVFFNFFGTQNEKMKINSLENKIEEGGLPK
jgi:hypothetical protein